MDILIAPQAEADLDNILQYVKLEFGLAASRRLESRTNAEIEGLKQWPEFHRMVYPDQEVRRAVVHLRVVMFYRYYSSTNQILVTRFRNTYQNYSAEDVF